MELSPRNYLIVIFSWKLSIWNYLLLGKTLSSGAVTTLL
jgi:hypothetical protein